MNQPGVNAGQVAEAEVSGREVASGKVFDEHIGPSRELSKILSVLLVVKIEEKTGLTRVMVGVRKGIRPSGATAVRSNDPDDLSPKIGQEPGTETRPLVCEVEHQNT